MPKRNIQVSLNLTPPNLVLGQQKFFKLMVVQVFPVASMVSHLIIHVKK